MLQNTACESVCSSSAIKVVLVLFPVALIRFHDKNNLKKKGSILFTLPRSRPSYKGLPELRLLSNGRIARVLVV